MRSRRDTRRRALGHRHTSCLHAALHLVGDDGAREVTVSLPPGYSRRTGQRYPSVYLLHGRRESDRAWNSGGSYRDWPDSSKPLSVRRLMEQGAELREA